MNSRAVAASAKAIKTNVWITMQGLLPILIVLTTLLSGCDDAFTRSGADQVVQYTARSPDAAVRALIVKEGFGATVPDVYSVRIVQIDKAPVEVLRADRISDLTLEWKGERTLEIGMTCGRVHSFTNLFDVIDRDGRLRYGIDVKLPTTSLCDDATPQAPAGER